MIPNVVTLLCMAAKRYSIDKSFGLFSRFTPPLSRGVLMVARAVLSVMPKGLRGGVRARRVQGQNFRALLIEPKDCAGTLPCLVYFHGGGFVFKAAGYHYRNAKNYCLGARCKVLFVDYPLAPKHNLPQISAACMAALRAVHLMAEEWGVDADRIAVGGDSAGGYLAAEAALQAQRQGVRKPCFAMLVYPVLDSRMNTASMKAFIDTPMWNARLNKKMWDYCRSPALSPSEEADVSGFPPAYIETAQFDCLHDEGAIFVARLKEQGVEVEYNSTAATMHGFDIAKNSPVTKEAIKRRIAALNAAFGKG